LLGVRQIDERLDANKRHTLSFKSAISLNRRYIVYGLSSPFWTRIL
jgi:hypothetical protein